ncbi:DNA translocase FtsK [Paenibacillus pinisoli]|uniref:DNA translocase FtsK n=1 Tax=Paenibacillus pinisoli TaxID=1276110 RepID=A0A3A6PKP6_9BACL|nr:FtsK/SpoIIIE domain-containing protein [Paenibacillus pinisoli]RJX40940.1 DNA translocase FtsK [Paenibacillus pinisoli]
MDKQEHNKKESYPKSYWQVMNRLFGIIAAALLAAYFLPDVPPKVREHAYSYLVTVIQIWTFIVALPWLIGKLWSNRELIKVRLLRNRSPKLSSQDRMLSVSVSGATASMSGERSAIMGKGGLPAAALIEPLTALPINPNPHPRSALTMNTAGAAISTALQLAEFAVEEDVTVLNVEAGPVLQIVSFQLPPKVQLSKLASKKDDIANHLGPQLGFDVTAAKDFKSAASFVIPHDIQDRAFVYMRDIAQEFLGFSSKAVLPVIFGKDIRGNPILYDLAKMPHLLVCGATGSGKSVFVNTLLTSLTSVRTPDEVKLLLIDPKQVEFGIYKGLPHLLTAPVTDMRKAIKAFGNVITEMERRYELFASTGTRNLSSYNLKHPQDKLPSIVVVIDEYADLMLVAGDVVEDAVQRITQMARAAGIHLILGTQRPSVNVVTGTIKANLPSRVTFKLPSPKDYMTVLDRGAPKLLGFGDGVCMVQGGDLQRFQSATISITDGEDTGFIERLIKHWKGMGSVKSASAQEWTIEDDELSSSQLKYAVAEEEEVPWEVPDDDGQVKLKVPSNARSSSSEGDPYDQALEIVYREGGFSVSTIQRELRVGFSTAASWAEKMMEAGIIGPFDQEKKWRPLLQKNERTEEELLDQLRKYICETKSTRTSELREQLSIRKEKVSELMQQLVQEGMLDSPTSTRAGYTIAWTEDQIQEYLSSIGDD